MFENKSLQTEKKNVCHDGENLEMCIDIRFVTQWNKFGLYSCIFLLNKTVRGERLWKYKTINEQNLTLSIDLIIYTLIDRPRFYKYNCMVRFSLKPVNRRTLEIQWEYN